jgi:hypothetical protein
MFEEILSVASSVFGMLAAVAFIALWNSRQLLTMVASRVIARREAIRVTVVVYNTQMEEFDRDEQAYPMPARQQQVVEA